MARKQTKTMTDEQKVAAGLNRKAMKLALGSLAKRGVTIDQLANSFDLVFTLDVMRSKYWNHFNGTINRDELSSAIEDCWNKYQSTIPA